MKVGIIGGSGLDDPKLLEDYSEQNVDTSFGKPSSKIVCGKLNDVDVCILARHGKDHSIPPHKVNYRANIQALKDLGCTHILATSAVGSLQEEIRPGDLVFPDQIIDFTKSRINTFYDDIGEVKHEPMGKPYSTELRSVLIDMANKMKLDNHEKAVMIVVEGPRFSTKAESDLFRVYGADIIGMTAAPEVFLAKEAGLEYATISMSTDYDCWKDDEEHVTFEIVKQRMKENGDKVKELITEALPKIQDMILKQRTKEYTDSVKDVCKEFDKTINK
tara:strand:+ start:676 stop:1500 length:825 start_codon:yes stop_codon:yes gene_type:complete